MFINDNPIESKDDDCLNRTSFSEELGKSLLDWQGKESLVIAIYGKWGSGKSSLINLTKEYLSNSQDQNKPTIITFNPWIFSGQSNLIAHFFDEVGKELECKDESKRDAEIAKQFRYYASVLGLFPSQGNVEKISKWIVLLGLIGVTSSQIMSWLNAYPWINYILFLIGVILLLYEITNDFFIKLSDVFQKKSEYNKKTILEIKNNLKDELKKRNKKMIIVIDDIDRLSSNEIRQIFKLIRVNADFPNTIYLLAFDRDVVEKNIEEQKGVCGKDYLTKIVQVDFDIPYVRHAKVSEFLFKELNKILDDLPEDAKNYFDDNDPYWANVYHSGYKDFFKNIRDVKRYISSLKFNIKHLNKQNVLEVNPVDFFAIEAIRVFAPPFYSFMKFDNLLFTSTDTAERNKYNPREKSINDALTKVLPEDIRPHLLDLIKRIFPQIESIYSHGYLTYGNEWQVVWKNKLKVCASDNFDSYFTLIPGGSDEEIGQYELKEFLSNINDYDVLKAKFDEYINNNKIRKLLQKIQDVSSNEADVPSNQIKNLIKVLFDISDNLPDERMGLFDFGIDVEMMRLVYQLLMRNQDKRKNYEMLKELIPTSLGFSGFIETIYLDDKKQNEQNKMTVPYENLDELKKICISKLNDMRVSLLDIKNLPFVMYRWKEWDGDQYQEFINEINKDNSYLLKFIEKFISVSRNQAAGDYGVTCNKEFNYKNLSDFLDIQTVKNSLEDIKRNNNDFYGKYKDTINMYLENYNQYQANPTSV